MIWLLRLYPRAWRQRYGDEFADLLRAQPWSPSLVIDLVAGAIDARLNPQLAAPIGKVLKEFNRSPSRRRCRRAGGRR